MKSLDLFAKTRSPSATRALLDTKQRLGILPTWWFWNDRSNYRPAAGFTVTAFTIVYSVVVIVEPGPLISGILCALAPYLTLGGLERIVRRRALARRTKCQEHAAQRSVHLVDE
jgi:hypothetical protein